ncbi:MAG: hypothetical protein JRG73_10140 [Deltaproteobacteria bacterium]|nr:hypothetical protein [Deltaproteobacteria bacterium]MBW2307284.1 hypothetical protein [Deltaproteobacteria bacterium]
MNKGIITTGDGDWKKKRARRFTHDAGGTRDDRVGCGELPAGLARDQVL